MDRKRKILLKLPKIACHYCGKKIRKARRNQVYCSDLGKPPGASCRQRANNERIREALRHAPPSAAAQAASSKS